jgi:hypothetical protein
MIDVDGKVWLLEINANPAIASGTMSRVPKQICHSLILDVLALAVPSLVAGNADHNFIKC